jgi:hypothetical protein
MQGAIMEGRSCGDRATSPRHNDTKTTPGIRANLQKVGQASSIFGCAGPSRLTGRLSHLPAVCCRSFDVNYPIAEARGLHLRGSPRRHQEMLLSHISLPDFQREAG